MRFAWQRSIVTAAGNVIPSAEIEVFNAGEITKPDLFSDDAGVAITNPFNATTAGFARFYVNYGNYDIAVNGVVVWANVLIGDPLLGVAGLPDEPSILSGNADGSFEWDSKDDLLGNYVNGAASSASDQVALFDGITGKLLKAGQTMAQYFDAFLVTLYNIFPRTIATVADIAAITPVGAGQLFNLKEYNEGTLLGGGQLVSMTGTTTPDNGITFACGGSFHLRRINYGDPTLEIYGGLAGIDNQDAWERLYTNNNVLSLGANDYAIDNMNIRKSFTIKTCGLRTRLIQNTGVTGTNQQISCITVAASDVTIGDISLVGTIASDTGEDRHGIRVDSTTVPGGISKINIGNISASHMRGDAVVITGSSGRQVSDFSIGNVFGFNIFRNGLSLVSGINGKIGVVSVAGEGLFAFDAEPDSGGGVVENIVVAGVRGRHCGVPAVTSVQRGIVFGFVDLDWSLPQSTPAFTPLQESESFGLVFRSTNGCHIEQCRIRNTPESAIRVYKEASDEYVDNISFGNLTIENCLTVAASDVCLIRAAGSKNWSVRGTLKYTLVDPATQELILDGATTDFVRLSVNRLEGNGPIGRFIGVDCASSSVSYAQDRTCIASRLSSTFRDAVWNVGIIAASSFGTVTFIGSNLTWNGSFKYADGIGTNFHTYELNTYASPTVSATPTWAATRVDS